MEELVKIANFFNFPLFKFAILTFSNIFSMKITRIDIDKLYG